MRDLLGPSRKRPSRSKSRMLVAEAYAALGTYCTKYRDQIEAHREAEIERAKAAAAAANLQAAE